MTFKTAARLRRHTNRSNSMSKLAAFILLVIATAGCSRSDVDQARSRAQRAQQQAKHDLDDANRKLKETFQQAGAETKQDLDKAREQLRQAARKTDQDLKKARDEVRDSQQQ